MEYKTWINYFLFILNIRHILPNKYIRRVKIKENNDPLIEIKENEFDIEQTIERPVYLRKEVYNKLLNIKKEIEKYDLKIKLYDAYRSKKVQEESWKRRLEETKLENPNLDDEELIRLTSLKVANTKDTENVGGHQTGGAIDITFIDKKNNKELEMGTKYEEYNKKTKMYSKEITDEAKRNRKLLRTIMKKEGFVNFPGEWWHFCYGDKMWAAYNKRKYGFYGYIEPNETENE